MTSIQQKPLNLPANRDERIARALELDDGCVLAGGLPSKLGFLPQSKGIESTPVQGETHRTGLTALARFVQLARRDRGQSPAVFATKLGLDLQEVVELESGCNAPELRVLHTLATGLGVSYTKLQVLVGYRQVRDTSLEREALKFAASSGPMDKLSRVEEQALQDFVRALHD